jgi:hypothetical protein
MIGVVLAQILRDILMGPLTEEFAFRSCMAPLLLLQVTQPVQAIYIADIETGGLRSHL